MSVKMMTNSPTMIAKVRSALEGGGQAESTARLLRDFLIDLRMEIGSIKSDCFCGVTPVVGASLAKLADYSSQLDDFFDRVGKDPEGFMREREAKRQALLPKNRRAAAKAETARIDAEVIYRAREQQVAQMQTEQKPPADPLSTDFAEAIYAARARQAAGSIDP
jgi:hypothetical protein